MVINLSKETRAEWEIKLKAMEDALIKEKWGETIETGWTCTWLWRASDRNYMKEEVCKVSVLLYIKFHHNPA